MVRHIGKADHRPAGYKKKDVHPRATFSIAKDPPFPSPLCLGCGGQTEKRQKKGDIFMVFLDSNCLCLHSLELLLVLFFVLAVAGTGREKAAQGEGDGEQ